MRTANKSRAATALRRWARLIFAATLLSCLLLALVSKLAPGSPLSLAEKADELSRNANVLDALLAEPIKDYKRVERKIGELKGLMACVGNSTGEGDALISCNGAFVATLTAEEGASEPTPPASSPAKD